MNGSSSRPFSFSFSSGVAESLLSVGDVSHPKKPETALLTLRFATRPYKRGESKKEREKAKKIITSGAIKQEEDEQKSIMKRQDSHMHS